MPVKNDVSLVAVFAVVLYAHSTRDNSSTQAPLWSSNLFHDNFVHYFDLAIGFRISRSY